MAALDETPPSTAVSRAALGKGSSTVTTEGPPQPPIYQPRTNPVGPLPTTSLQMPPFFVPPMQQTQPVHSTMLPPSHVFNIPPLFIAPPPYQVTGGQSSMLSVLPLTQTTIGHTPPAYSMVDTWIRPTITANNSLQQTITVNPMTPIQYTPILLRLFPPTTIPVVPLLRTKPWLSRVATIWLEPPIPATGSVNRPRPRLPFP
ncbi:proline-rich receptor-like protein kinase PERK2 [Lactuca sativa]|uniref:proline-rich receptor-like protein kinase PERK2 n=1 Tax=Lactuca sativa TaxID=4236 RepID=UPI000CD97781|nr:proline-rich receptor-like protein kinase PERK2 [Lactuca sativa]